jgi:hypothetical protein
MLTVAIKTRTDDLYVMGLVGELQINFLIDTGSTETFDPQQQQSLQGRD